MNHSAKFFFSYGKKCHWHLYPGCHRNMVAMRSIYLEIWRLQMSLGAAFNNNALAKLHTFKVYSRYLL